MSLFQHFAGRRTPRPNAPEPATEQRAFAPPEPMRIDPTSGSAPAAFAPPEPSSSPTRVNAFGVELVADGITDPRSVNPAATTGKPLMVYPMSAPGMKVTPIDVRNHSGEQS